MKNHKFPFPGSTAIDWTNGTGVAVASGAIVEIDGAFGIAATDIADGAVGILQTSGAFALPKATGVGTAIAEGAIVYFDRATSVVTATKTGSVLGRCRFAADDDAEEVTVDLAITLGTLAVFQTTGVAGAAEGAADAIVVDTGFGVAPAGAVYARINNNVSGVERDGTVITLLGGADAGKIQIANSNLAETDPWTLIAFRN